MTGRAAALAPLVLLALSLVVPAAAAGATCEVFLRATAEVSADVIRIGDLADMAGAAAGPVAEAVVAYAPGLNLDRIVSRNNVAQAIRDRFAFPVSIDGAAQVRVRRASLAAPCLTADELKSRATALFLERRPDLAEGAFRIEVAIDEARIPRGPSDSVDLTLSNVLGDRITGRLTARFDRTYSRGCLFSLAGDVERRVFRARRFLKKGETIADTDVSEETVSAPLGRRHAGLDRSPAGLAAKTNVREGTVLCADQFVRTVCVKKGDKVILASDKDLIQVEVPAQALEDGDVGDVVRVKNLMSGQPVRALIDGPGRVSPAGGR